MNIRGQRILCHSYYVLYGMLGSGLVLPLVNRFEVSYKLSHGEMGTLMGAGGVLFSLSSILGGYLDGHFGSRRVLAWSVLLCALTALWVGGSSHILSFLAAYLAWQAANGLTQTVNGTVSRLYGKDRASGINLLHGFQGVGRLLAPLVVVRVIRLTGDWPTVLLISAALHLAWSLLFRLGLPAHEPLPPAEHAVRPAVGPLLRSKVLWTAMVAFMFLTGAEFASMTWVPVFLEREAGLDLDTALTGLTIMMIGYTAARAAVGLMRRHPKPWAISAMAALLCGSMALILTVQPWWALLALSGVLGLSFGCWWPTLAATLFDAEPYNHGVLAGLCNISSTAGILVFSTAMGWLGDAVGLRYALWVPPACAIVFAVLYRILWGLGHPRASMSS